MKSIAKGLPSMCRAFDMQTMTLKASTRANASLDMIHDLELIVPAYKAFLDDKGLYDTFLYEPDFSKPANDGSLSSSYVLVFPNSLSDAYAESALKYCKRFDLDFSNASTEILSEKPKLKLFSNSIAETRACIRKVYSLLASGVLPNDIAISCPNVEAYMPYLEMEASKRDICLSFTTSKPLLEYIPGKFFKALLRAREENYSMESMKELLLDPCFPYKDRDVIVRIIEKSIKCKIQEGVLIKWCKKLSALGEDELSQRLSAISTGISSVVDCKDASMLHENVMILVKSLFGETTWTRELSSNDGLEYENARVFGSCANELGTLSFHANLLGMDKPQDLFGLFIDILGDKVYTPNVGRDNIKVYEYPLDAGLAVKHHFIIGLTDTNTRILRNPYPFLPYEKTKTLEDVLHLGSSVLELYSHVFINNGSDINNGSVWLSSSEEGFSGADVVPTSFLGDENLQYVKNVEDDSFSLEESLWKNPENLRLKDIVKDFVITQKQKTCFNAAYNTALNYSNKMKFKAPSLPFYMGVSRVKAFEECPYKGYAYCVLKLKEVDFEPRMNDAAQIGDILHATIQRALKESGSLGALNAQRLKSIFREELENYSKKPNATDKSHIAYIRKRYEDILQLVYESGSASFIRDMQFKAMEDDTSFAVSNDVVSIMGMADCILEDKNGNYAVIDFKKNAGAYYKPTDLDKTSLQLAIYAKMMEENPKFGCSPTFGAYYSVEDGSFKYVWPPVTIGRSNQGADYNGEVKENYEKRMNNLSSVLEKATFYPTPLDDSCKYCSFYNLCRGGFETV